jgi:uncharacterized protein YecE (DUF72 family)
MESLKIGTSGWSYNEWTGVFYPSSSTSKLSFYSKFYETVEVDSTFYSYPAKGTVLGWDRHTPDNFVFSVKLPRLITHEKRLGSLSSIESDMMKFLILLKPLIDKGKLGPILVQLPPSFKYDGEKDILFSFMQKLPSDLMFAVEFRHPSWLREDVFSEMKAKNVAFAIVDEPLLPPETIVTADFSFIRWHGRGSRPWYNYRYTESELSQWVPKVKKVVSKTKMTYGYFNNHFRGFAIENSLKMMKMLNLTRPEQEELLLKVSSVLDSKKKASSSRETSMLEYM